MQIALLVLRNEYGQNISISATGTLVTDSPIKDANALSASNNNGKYQLDGDVDYVDSVPASRRRRHLGLQVCGRDGQSADDEWASRVCAHRHDVSFHQAGQCFQWGERFHAKPRYRHTARSRCLRRPVPAPYRLVRPARAPERPPLAPAG